MSTAEPQTKTNCNICQKDDFTVLYGPGVAQVNQIVKCNECGLMYANPRRDADCIKVAAWPYDPAYNLQTHFPLRFEKERLQVRDFRSSHALLNHLHPFKGNIVEVGS